MNLRILPKVSKEERAPVTKASARMMSMHAAPTRKPFQIMAVKLAPEDRRPLERMGILPGRYAKLLHNDHKGTVVMELAGETFILGRRETRHIQIKIR